MGLFLIAEIGINHNGDLEIAKRLITAAHRAGFDAVKFQKRTVHKVYSKEFLDGPRDSPWGTTVRAQKEGLELSFQDYQEIDRHCRDLGIPWFASAWDTESQRFLRPFDPPYNKVASAMLGNWPLLRMIASERKRTFISTGMATLDEVDAVVDLFRTSGCPFQLMHSVSTYPMKETDANLLCIPMLRERYKCDVGYSGHEVSLVKICCAAVALGATSLERHITLDRTMYGSDQAASVSARVLDDFVESVRTVALALGNGKKQISAAEGEVRKKLRVEAPDDPTLGENREAHVTKPR